MYPSFIVTKSPSVGLSAFARKPEASRNGLGKSQGENLPLAIEWYPHGYEKMKTLNEQERKIGAVVSLLNSGSGSRSTTSLSEGHVARRTAFSETQGSDLKLSDDDELSKSSSHFGPSVNETFSLEKVFLFSKESILGRFLKQKRTITHPSFQQFVDLADLANQCCLSGFPNRNLAQQERRGMSFWLKILCEGVEEKNQQKEIEALERLSVLQTIPSGVFDEYVNFSECPDWVEKEFLSVCMSMFIEFAPSQNRTKIFSQDNCDCAINAASRLVKIMHPDRSNRRLLNGLERFRFDTEQIYKMSHLAMKFLKQKKKRSPPIKMASDFFIWQLLGFCFSFVVAVCFVGSKYETLVGGLLIDSDI